MIVTAASLVTMAIAMLIWGMIAGQLTAVYASVGVSVVSAILLAIGVFVRRREVFGDSAGSGAATVPHGAAAAVGTAGLGKTAVPVGGAQRGVAGDTARVGTGRSAEPARTGPTRFTTGPEEDTYEVPTGLDVPGDAIVHVVAGRRRYHLGSCRQLKGRQSEELTYEEAHEEGFSACTACMPDTALAARAARAPQPSRVSTPAHDAPATPGGSSREGGRSAKPDLEEPKKVSPQNSTWDGQSVQPGEDEGEGEGDSDSAGTVGPRNSTWDGQSVTPDKNEDEAAGEDETAGTVSPQNSTWDGQSVQPGEDEATADDDAKDASAESAAADTQPAEEDAAAPGADTGESVTGESDTSESDTENTEDDDTTDTTDTEDGEASTDADAGGAGKDTGDGDTEATDAEPVQVVQGTNRYHRPECALVKAVPDEEITSMAQARAVEEGYGPCLACEPDKTPAR